MRYKIDKHIIDKAISCNFAKECLEQSDKDFFCQVIEGSSSFLLVDPSGSSRKNLCSYHQEMKTNGESVILCHCPVRMEFFRKYSR